jgi:hypothetical protein
MSGVTLYVYSLNRLASPPLLNAMARLEDVAILAGSSQDFHGGISSAKTRRPFKLFGPLKFNGTEQQFERPSHLVIVRSNVYVNTRY